MCSNYDRGTVMIRLFTSILILGLLSGCSYKIESYEAKWLLDYCKHKGGVHNLRINPGCNTVTCNNGQVKSCMGQDE